MTDKISPSNLSFTQNKKNSLISIYNFVEYTEMTAPTLRTSTHRIFSCISGDKFLLNMKNVFMTHILCFSDGTMMTNSEIVIFLLKSQRQNNSR